MPATEKIKIAIERSARALSLKPSLGLGTGISTTRITNGLACDISEGPWKLKADMPEAVGGDSTGPTPGVYGRAALGSCLAIGYMMAASKNNLPISMLEVEVQADYDDGVLFGTTTNVPPGYIEVRYIVKVDSEAPEEKIIEMVESADRLSPYLDIFSRAQNCKRNILITSSKES